MAHFHPPTVPRKQDVRCCLLLVSHQTSIQFESTVQPRLEQLRMHNYPNYPTMTKCLLDVISPQEVSEICMYVWIPYQQIS